MKADSTHSPVSFDAPKDSYDISALKFTRDNLIRVVCISCGYASLYGASIEGLCNLYFRSHWHVLNPNAKIEEIILPIALDIDALCKDCLEAYANERKAKSD
jgi:hypothetical protein